MVAALPEHVKGWNISSGESQFSVAEAVFWAGGVIYQAGGPFDDELKGIDPRRAALWVEPSAYPYPRGTTILQIDTLGRPQETRRPMAGILHFCIALGGEVHGPEHDLVIPDFVMRETDDKDDVGVRVLRDLGFDGPRPLGYRASGLVARAQEVQELLDVQFPEFADAVPVHRVRGNDAD